MQKSLYLKDVFEKILFIYVFLIPFTVSSIVSDTGLLLLMTVLTFFIGTIVLINNRKKIYLGRIVIYTFFIPLLLALLIGSTTAMLFSPLGINYWELPEVMIGRLLNYLFVFIIFQATLLLYQNKTNFDKDLFFLKYIKAYWLGCFILLFIGFWQVLSWSTGIPFPFEGMRTHVHSVDAAMRALIGGRMTSITNEPSFLAPFIIDFALISMLLFVKRKMYFFVGMALLGVFYTFSGGGYMNVGMIIFAATCVLFVKSILKRNKTMFVCFLSMILIMIALFVFFVLPGIENSPLMIVFSRGDAILDTESHSRAAFIFKPFILMQESTWLNMLFGHGPKSYELIGTRFNFAGEPFHVTSNNLFTDIFWEHGMVGLLGLIVLFTYFLRNSISIFKENSKEEWVLFMFTIHLFASSLYRADFASGRFYTLLIIFIFLIYRKKEKWKNKSDEKIQILPLERKV